jgi:hypothetical protein
MVVPLIPILAGIAMVTGAGTLIWYKRLSKEERERADKMAARVARDLFEKPIEELKKIEAKKVFKVVREKFKSKE